MAYMNGGLPHAVSVEFIYVLAQTMAVPACPSGMGISEQARPARNRTMTSSLWLRRRRIHGILTSNAHQAYQSRGSHPGCNRRFSRTQPYRLAIRAARQVARFDGSDGLLRWAARLNGRGTAVGGDLGTGTGNP